MFFRVYTIIHTSKIRSVLFCRILVMELKFTFEIAIGVVSQGWLESKAHRAEDSCPQNTILCRDSWIETQIILWTHIPVFRNWEMNRKVGGAIRDIRRMHDRSNGVHSRTCLICVCLILIGGHWWASLIMWVALRLHAISCINCCIDINIIVDGCTSQQSKASFHLFWATGYSWLGKSVTVTHLSTP